MAVLEELSLGGVQEVISIGMVLRGLRSVS